MYNALNGKQYSDPDALEIVTLENAIYMGMKNDLAFILDFNIHSVLNPLLHFLQSVFRMITVNTQIQEFCKIQIQK